MKVLLVQTGFLGDVVLSTPLIAALKKLDLDTEVWMLTSAMGAELVRNIPELSGIITFDKKGAERGLLGLLRKATEIKKHSFAAVYSLHKSYRTALLLTLSRIPKRVGFKGAALSWLYTESRPRQGAHAVIGNLSLLGLGHETSVFPLRLVVPDDSEIPEEYLNQLKVGEYVVVAPGSVWETKRWYWKHYRTVVENLIGQGKKVVIVGAPEEADVCGAVADGLPVMNLAGRINLTELMFAISKARLLICNDSLPLHIASAFKVPTVALFCATSPKFGFGPWQNLSRIVEKEGLHCKPCRRHGSRVCPQRTDACMKELAPSKVLAAVDELLRERGQHAALS